MFCQGEKALEGKPKRTGQVQRNLDFGRLRHFY
ncbi:Protein of unknown function [Lactobacillus delbrueckii subsp. bulgaricus]|nr:Protein of unknown function [Lactobacillus delbrueckii subsp. bulgaricus]